MSDSVVWLQLSAGQGPKECGWVVARLKQRILQSAQHSGLQAEIIETLAFDKLLRNQELIEPDAFLSVLMRIEGQAAKVFAQSWVGTVQWKGASPYRPKHKRVNWYAGVALVEVPGDAEVSIQEIEKAVKVEAIRSGGPGGQHVNKTSSAVRVAHLPSGLVVRVDVDRSQHRNKRLALERLQLLLAGKSQSKKEENERERWLLHYQVQRGNPCRIFYGEEFIEKN